MTEEDTKVITMRTKFVLKTKSNSDHQRLPFCYWSKPKIYFHRCVVCVRLKNTHLSPAVPRFRRANYIMDVKHLLLIVAA